LLGILVSVHAALCRPPLSRGSAVCARAGMRCLAGSACPSCSSLTHTARQGRQRARREREKELREVSRGFHSLSLSSLLLSLRVCGGYTAVRVCSYTPPQRQPLPRRLSPTRRLEASYPPTLSASVTLLSRFFLFSLLSLRLFLLLRGPLLAAAGLACRQTPSRSRRGQSLALLHLDRADRQGGRPIRHPLKRWKASQRDGQGEQPGWAKGGSGRMWRIEVNCRSARSAPPLMVTQYLVTATSVFFPRPSTPLVFSHCPSTSPSLFPFSCHSARLRPTISCCSLHTLLTIHMLCSPAVALSPRNRCTLRKASATKPN